MEASQVKAPEDWRSPRRCRAIRKVRAPIHAKKRTWVRGCFLVAVFQLYLADFQAEDLLASGTESFPAAAATNALRPSQISSTNKPPLAPMKFNPDAGVPPASTNLVVPKPLLQLRWATNSTKPAQPPSVFNPDPGAMLRLPSTNALFFTNGYVAPSVFQGVPVPPALTLPRTNVRRMQIEFVEPPVTNY